MENAWRDSFGRCCSEAQDGDKWKDTKQEEEQQQQQQREEIMKRKRDYRWASIEKVKLRRHPNEKKGEVFIKIRNKSIFFLATEREREGGRRESESEVKQNKKQG